MYDFAEHVVDCEVLSSKEVQSLVFELHRGGGEIIVPHPQHLPGGPLYLDQFGASHIDAQ